MLLLYILCIFVTYMKATINKWGNSLGIRLPKSLSEQYKLSDGIDVELIQTDKGILIKKKEIVPSLDEIIKSYPKKYKPEDLIPNELTTEQW